MYKGKDLSIYTHIPFCLKRCNYCDFLTFCGDDAHYEGYVAALCKDIADNSAQFAGHEVKTVFFGGGTPTCLSTKQLGAIISAITSHYKLSPATTISTEANPETITAPYAQALNALGIGRISIGVQTFDDETLRLIGRLHSRQRALDAIGAAHAAGFKDIGIDLIFSLPHQDEEAFARDLDIALSLPITHISTYSLTIEDNTPIAAMPALLAAMPSDKQDRRMYATAKERLQRGGFTQYEISNFAKAGFECRHNINYWTRGEYIGFGIGAHSFVGGVRFKRTDDLAAYIQGGFAPIILEEVDNTAAMSECMILGLRLTRGVNASDFNNEFGMGIHEAFGDIINGFIKQGLLAEEGGHIRLTSKGIDLSNTVFAAFI